MRTSRSEIARRRTAVSASAADRLAARLLEHVPVSARRVEVGGVSTSLLEGGAGSPVVLLHGAGGFAESLGTALASIMDRHRVVAPDLPGLGRSTLLDAPPGRAAVLSWLGELIAATCAEP